MDCNVATVAEVNLHMAHDAMIPDNGDIHDWTDFPPSGSYTVDPDCTGSFFDADGNKTNNLVVFDGGKRFLLLSVAPDTITTEEGTKLEVKEND